MAVENEYKFTSDRADADECLSALRTFIDNSGIPYSISFKSYTDTYYDSNGMGITSDGCFIRKRIYSNGKCKLTVKKPISVNGPMSREEIEKVTDGSFGSLQEFCDECFFSIVLDPVPKLTNVCERTVFSLDDGSGIKLSFDKCQYADVDRRKEYLEIELEVLSDAVVTDFDRIGLVDFVINSLNFTRVYESKYVRGLRWKKEN